METEYADELAIGFCAYLMSLRRKGDMQKRLHEYKQLAMKKFFKTKIKAYDKNSTEFYDLQQNMSPACVLYTGPASGVNFKKYGLTMKKFNKALDKRFGTQPQIEEHMHAIVYIKYNAAYFTSDEAFVASLKNYKEYISTE